MAEDFAQRAHKQGALGASYGSARKEGLQGLPGGQGADKFHGLPRLS